MSSMSNMDPFSINAQLIQSLGLGIPYLHHEGTRKLVPTSFSDLPVSQSMPLLYIDLFINLID